MNRIILRDAGTGMKKPKEMRNIPIAIMFAFVKKIWKPRRSRPIKAIIILTARSPKKLSSLGWGNPKNGNMANAMSRAPAIFFKRLTI